MPIQKARVDILPKSGMDPQTAGGVKWIRNMKRWTATAPLEVRPGFGQRAQIDTTASISTDNANKSEGEITNYLGSYLYNSNFDRRQILSVFSVVASHSSAKASDLIASPGGTKDTWYQSIHGFSEAVIFSVFDLTTKETWEELITFKTSEGALADDLDKAFGHFETVATFNKDALVNAPTKVHDYRSFKKASSTVAFVQISDSVYFSSPELGTWVYHGIDVPAKINEALIDGNCPAPQRFALDLVHSNNLHSGKSEGSVIKPISGTRGINGRDVVYLTKAEIPRSVGMAEIGGRIAYTSQNVVWFSDVNQPGAIMAENFASWSAEGQATAIASYQNRLFVFTDKEAHAFSLRPQGVAGSPVPGVIDILSVETNHEAGCVSSRSHCWTPYGIWYVSDWGVHAISSPESIQTLSDQVYDHWGDGLKDPLSNYNLNQGKPGEAGKKHAPMLFSHVGEPSVAYDVESDSLMVCYESHVLLYHFETKGWHVWPLGVRDNTTGSEGSYFTSFTGQGVVSDADGTYLISGVQDLDNSISTNPYNENGSYVISELGLGGGPDRTIENEDFRRFGGGRYKLLEATESFAGGALPSPMSPGDAYTQNGWLLFIEPVDQWIARGVTTTTDTQYKSYDVFILRTENADPPAGALSFKLSVAGNWAFVGTSIGSHSQCGSKAAFTIAAPATNQVAVTTPSLAGLPLTKTPLIRFTISNGANKTLATLTDPIFTLIANEATDGNGTLRSVRAYAWLASYRFPASNNMWNAFDSQGRRLTGTNGISGDPNFFDGSAVHRRDVEWGVVTGDLGAGDGAMHRIRDVRAFMETGGQDDTSGTKFMGLYNVTVASDYKMLSGQKLDYTDPYIADRDALKKETIRNRMTAGKRVFDSVAVWHNPASASTNDYLVDNPENNEIDISTHARGESVVAALFGRVTSIGTYIRFHKAVALIQSYVSNRRKGR